MQRKHADKAISIDYTRNASRSHSVPLFAGPGVRSIKKHKEKARHGRHTDSNSDYFPEPPAEHSILPLDIEFFRCRVNTHRGCQHPRERVATGSRYIHRPELCNFILEMMFRLRFPSVCTNMFGQGGCAPRYTETVLLIELERVLLTVA
jgi:hypothetical protein